MRKSVKKNLNKLSALIMVFALCMTVIQFPAIEVAAAGNLPDNIYYGMIHNHSNLSDGIGTPEQAYDYARYTSGLDFFSLADHSGRFYNDNSKWQQLKDVANSKNSNGQFVTFWGFEWTSSAIVEGGYGHVTVLGTDDFCSTNDQATNNFSELVDWLNQRNGIAFLNHPGREDDTPMDINDDREFNHFNSTPTDKIVGMELWNRDSGFAEFYDCDGYEYEDDNLSYFDEANTKGWHIGAAGSEDNHSGTWGQGEFRHAVIAEAKTREAIWDSLSKRHFYSTEDKNLQLRVKLGSSYNNLTNMMGDIVNPGTYYISVDAKDTSNDAFKKLSIIKRSKNGYMNAWHGYADYIGYTSSTGEKGIAHSGNIELKPGEYLYVIVEQNDGNRAISSPIFATGTPVASSGDYKFNIKTGLDSDAETDESVHSHIYATFNGVTCYEYEATLGNTGFDKGVLSTYTVQGPLFWNSDLNNYNKMAFSIPKREGELKIEAVSMDYNNKTIYAGNWNAWVSPSTNYHITKNAAIDQHGPEKIGFIRLVVDTNTATYSDTADNVYFGIELANGASYSYQLKNKNSNSDNFDKGARAQFYVLFPQSRQDVRKLFVSKSGSDGWRPHDIYVNGANGSFLYTFKRIDTMIDDGTPYYNKYLWDKVFP